LAVLFALADDDRRAGVVLDQEGLCGNSIGAEDEIREGLIRESVFMKGLPRARQSKKKKPRSAEGTGVEIWATLFSRGGCR
jgi:hypothetical protein